MNKKIKFGFFFDFRNPPQWRLPWNDLYGKTLDFISWTESIGFDIACVAEHHNSEDGYIPSPLVAASAIAMRTKTMRIGTSLCVAPLYHPVRFAEDCALIDILSNGRFEVALGVGWRQSEMSAYGADMKKRGRYTDEFIDIVQRLWRGETVNQQSEFFNLIDAAIMPPPLQQPLPLYIGGFSPKALERAAKCDGYQAFPDCYPQYLDAVRAQGKSEDEAKLSFLHPGFIVSNDPDKTFEEIGPHYLYTNNAYAEWQVSANYDADKTRGHFKPMDLADLKASGALTVLTPGQAIDYLREQQATANLESFLAIAPGGFLCSAFNDHAALFAREVIPAFR